MTPLHLLAVLAHVAGKGWCWKINFEAVKLFLLREHGFYHGNAAVTGWGLLFFYFQEADTGITALISGTQRDDGRRAFPDGDGGLGQSAEELNRLAGVPPGAREPHRS